MIEIYLLEQLLAFYHCGTLSAASGQLHLSQPAVSRAMKKLESSLEVTLFERHKNKITLNENGRMAAEYAGKILDLEKEMTARIRAFDRLQHTFSLGSCAPMPVTQLTPLLSQTYKGMTIASEIKTEDQLLRGLADDTYQLIVLTHPVDSENYENRK